MLVITTRYQRTLLQRFQDQTVHDFTLTENNEMLRERQKARVSYKTGNMAQRKIFLQHAKAFASQIIAVFSEADYREFISKTKNFQVVFFPEYIEQFCCKHSIPGYSSVDSKEKCFLEDEAYETILTLCQSYLLANVTSFWQTKISQWLSDDS